jgi:hypothetical protein
MGWGRHSDGRIQQIYRMIEGAETCT